MIRNILDKVAFDKYEIEYYNRALIEYNAEQPMSDTDNSVINDMLNECIPYAANNQYQFSFAPSATDIIKQLFEKYVDDDTLVITTDNEHPNVRKLIKQCKNVVYAIKKQRFCPFEIKRKYKRIFVYMIGMYCGTGHIVKLKEFEYAINAAKEMCDNVVSVIDAVQEIFIMPRNYSMFDYIIGTGHALIEKYNVGFVISKKRDVGRPLQIAIPFTHMLRTLLERRVYLNEFRLLMQDYFNESFYFGCKSVAEANHLFLLESKGNTFDGFIQKDDILPTESKAYKGVLFRACWSVVNKEGFFQKLDQVDFALENFKNNQLG